MFRRDDRAGNPVTVEAGESGAGHGSRPPVAGPVPDRDGRLATRGGTEASIGPSCAAPEPHCPGAGPTLLRATGGGKGRAPQVPERAGPAAERA